MREQLLPVLAVLAVGGCMADVNMSSRSILGPADSGAISNRDMYSAAKEVTRLLGERGFELVDQHVDAPNGELQLKFDNASSLGAGHGAVFYAWVTPVSATSSKIALLGKPTVAGVEPCTNDGVALPCEKISTYTEFTETFLSGDYEAGVAHGVLSELALEGFTTGPLPVAPADEAAALHAACAAKAQQIHAQADRQNDVDARDALLETVPNCDAVARR